MIGRHEITVEWGDCDPAAIVFYPNYFRWFDQATRHLFEAAGLPFATLFRQYGVVGVPLVDARARFIAPARFGDRLSIESRIALWKPKTFEVGHVVRKAGEITVEGAEIRFWGLQHPDDPERLKAGPIPKEIIEKFVETEHA